MVMVFILWPFIDKSEKYHLRKRPLLLATFCGIIIIWLGLTFRGSQ
jgi:quinol-cytochrome oxidoreductase complex cytochrome b subunit